MRHAIPRATVARLPIYLQCLNMLPPGASVISSDALAEIARVKPSQVRKDLSYLSTTGVRGVGYELNDLTTEIRSVLGIDHEWSVVIVGVGNLGSALANYKGFAGAGFSIVGIYDRDPAKIGQRANSHLIKPLSALESDVDDLGVSLAILATHAHGAQEAADEICRVGIRSILNFAPTMLRVPEEVAVRKVDLATELQILSFYSQKQAVPDQASGTGHQASARHVS